MYFVTRTVDRIVPLYSLPTGFASYGHDLRFISTVFLRRSKYSHSHCTWKCRMFVSIVQYLDKIHSNEREDDSTFHRRFNRLIIIIISLFPHLCTPFTPSLRP